MKPPFRLYPEEKHWWSMADYGAVMDVMARLKPKRVLEFGPGSSTLALIEGGAEHIDTCEDNPDWEQVYRERLEATYPKVVQLHAYTAADPIVVPTVGRRRYDLALVDGPLGTLSRVPVIAFCLERAKAVLIPTEDLKPGDGRLRPHIMQVANDHQRTVEWMETGPLAGGFALLTNAGGRAK